jgi:hypothetical protein
MPRTSTRPARDYSIRIRLEGARTVAEMLAMVHDAAERLKDSGVKKVKGLNLYVTPLDENGSPVMIRDEARRRIKIITVKAPYRSAADEYGA